MQTEYSTTRDLENCRTRSHNSTREQLQYQAKKKSNLEDRVNGLEERTPLDEDFTDRLKALELKLETEFNHVFMLFELGQTTKTKRQDGTGEGGPEG